MHGQGGEARTPAHSHKGGNSLPVYIQYQFGFNNDFYEGCRYILFEKEMAGVRGAAEGNLSKVLFMGCPLCIVTVQNKTIDDA